MEISQIAGKNKDPVATVEEETQLRSAGAINAVQPVKKDAESGNQPRQQQEDPTFAHLGEEPLQLLLRAVTARLNEYIPVVVTPIPVALAVQQKLTPPATASRIVAMIAMTFERYRLQHEHTPETEVVDTFRRLIDDALSAGLNETREVLANLGLLEDVIASDLEQTVTQTRDTLTRLQSLSESG